MKTILLSVHELRHIVQHVGLDELMDEMVQRLTDALRNFDESKMVNPTREGFTYTEPQVGLVEWMPVWEVGNRVTIKIVGYHPSNPTTRHLPTILSTVTAYDTSTGHLIGMMDGTFLTALRTGAASAVATRVLASPNAKTLGLIGCGAQAVTQLHAISRVTNVEHVLAYDIDPKTSQSFPERVSSIPSRQFELQICDVEEVIQGADILCTSTSVGVGEGPVFEDKGLNDWVHINAIGADFPGKTEVPVSVLKRSYVCHDLLEQVLKEGECQQLSPEDIGASLVELVANPESFEEQRNTMTVFDSAGWAVEDHIGMKMFLDYASELNLGTESQIEAVSDDPKHPYGFVVQG